MAWTQDDPNGKFFIDYALTADGYGRCLMETKKIDIDNNSDEEYQPIQPQELAEELLRKTGNRPDNILPVIKDRLQALYVSFAKG